MGVWRCGNRLEGMKCPKSPSYHEDVLQNNILKAINGMIGNTENVESAVVSSAEKLQAENELIDTEISEIEFDENTVDKLIQKIEAVNKDEIAVIFCGGFRIVQTIEK